jgi:retinol dehydrogenase-12
MNWIYSRGVMVPPLDQVTTDGYDLQFGTNVLGMYLLAHSRHRRLTFHHIGHFYFTKLLLPTLISTAKSSQDGKARVVNTSSSAHMFSNLNFETFKDGPERRKKTTETFYAQSKFVNYLSFWLGDEAIA